MGMASLLTMWSVLLLFLGAPSGWAAERLLGVQSARVMSQSMPWIAEETGIFRKYNLEFPLAEKWKAFGWTTHEVDGHEVDAPRVVGAGVERLQLAAAVLLAEGDPQGDRVAQRIPSGRLG